MNFVPFLIVGLTVWIALMFTLRIPVWVWWVMFAAVASVYGPIADAIVWRLYHREREDEVAAQTAIIDAHLARIERNHGAAARKRAVELAMKETRHDLTPEERAELDSLCNTRPIKRAAE